MNSRTLRACVISAGVGAVLALAAGTSHAAPPDEADLRIRMTAGPATEPQFIDPPNGAVLPDTLIVGVGETYRVYTDTQNFGPSIAAQVFGHFDVVATMPFTQQSCAFSVSRAGPGAAIIHFTCTTGNVGAGATPVGIFGASLVTAPPQDPPDNLNRVRGAFRGSSLVPGVIDYRGVASSDTADPVLANNTARVRVVVVPPAPTPANGFVSPTSVSTAGGTLVVAASLDLGDKTVDFTDAANLTFGTQVLSIPDGLAPDRRRTRWSYTSPNRDVRLLVLPPNPRSRTSKGRMSLRVRNWSGMLPPFPGGGDALDVGLQVGAFDVQSTVQLVGGAHRANVQLASAPPLVLQRVAGFLSGPHTPRVAVTASFAGDGVVPAAPPNVVLRIGEPGNPFRTVVPSPDHIVTPTANGYRYTIPDPDGTGPLLPQGPWYVDVDFVHRRAEVHVRGEDLGSFPRGTAPFLFGLGVGGDEHAVQVCVDDRSGSRLGY